MSLADKLIILEKSVQSHLDALGKIGFNPEKPEDGHNRLAFTPEEQEAHDYIAQELKHAGFIINTDAFFDNLIASKKGNYPNDGIVMLGTHLDTVSKGGNYDGSVGAIVHLEAVKLAEAEKGQLDINIDNVVFRAEESTRFKEGCFGSRMAFGLLKPMELWKIEYLKRNYGDNTPITDPSDYPEVVEQGRRGGYFFDPSSYKAYLEVHVEQGRVLEEEGKNVGIVTSIRAPVRYKFELIGRADHSGATPMGLKWRRDPMAGLLEMGSAVEKICCEYGKRGLDIVGTMAGVEVPYLSINRIPERLTFYLDLRSNNESVRNAVEKEILGEFRRVANERNLKLEDNLTERSQPVSQLDLQLCEKLETAAYELGIPNMRLPSGAGHDAMKAAQVGIPTAMLFVPSRDGISHNPREYTENKYIVDAIRVIAYTLMNFK